MKVLDLFAGIGGFSLGLERTGYFETAAFCEFDRKAREVLRKNWPHIPIYNDVRELTGEQLKKDGISIDVITGGFPCQDLSFAGRGAGLSGERSSLWFEYLRLIKEISPKWVIIENVSALRSRGLDEVLGGLAEVGYDAEWHCIPASALGAPHQRDRIWIVAYPHGTGFEQGNEAWAGGSTEQPDGGGFQSASNVPHANQPRLERWLQNGIANSQGWEEQGDGRATERSTGWQGCRNNEWASEPAVGRVADGFPGRVDQLKQLGNAVVPQIPELIGRAIHAASTS